MKDRIHIYGPTYIDHTIYLQDQISLDGSARIEEEKLYPGGTGLCYAIALSRLGNPVILRSIIGKDEGASIVKQTIQKEPNLEAEWQECEGSTDHAYVLIDEGNHKTVASSKKQSNRYSANGDLNGFESAKAVVLTSFRNDITNRILKSMSTKKIKAPYVMWAPHLPNCKDATVLSDTLQLVDHITLSAEEYDALTRTIGEPIQHGVKSVTITNGKNGCDLVTQEGSRHFNAHRVVENPLDTNGAGEAFGAGFLTAYLETGDYEVSIRAGSYNGFLHVHRHGSDFPTLPINELIQHSQPSKQVTMDSNIKITEANYRGIS